MGVLVPVGVAEGVTAGSSGGVVISVLVAVCVGLVPAVGNNAKGMRVGVGCESKVGEQAESAKSASPISTNRNGLAPVQLSL